MLRILLVLFLMLTSCTESVHEVKLRDTSGRSVPLSQFRGKPLVVYVWSGTCIGHTEDLRELVKLYPKVRERAELISVAVMMSPGDVESFLRKVELDPDYPILADEKGEFAQKVTLVFLPATLIFDEEGRLVESYPGLPENLLSLIPSH
ncbi:MAG TPA: TlpA family protein disulfide reductase [Aquifex aeolicus]|uniref:TlpA family protein disulfide reductase n=1 Tax=Aquifex aeolicus TaxID=63363 RepID=A0A7C5Q7U9_AQUAO|nr:TlpA family protein disulfide reductase [Aquifex aeolicus]